MGNEGMGAFTSALFGGSDKTESKKFNFDKVQLHLHLDGCLRFSTILELANKKHIDLRGAKTIDDLKKLLVTTKPTSLAEVLGAFDIFLPVIIGDLEAIERVAYEACEDQHKDGVIYFEGRYSPHLLSTETVGPSDVVKAVWKGFERGHKDFGIIARSIICCIRGHDVWNKGLVQLAFDHKDHGVVAIDAAGCSHGADEQYEPSVVAAFLRAESLGIHRTVHAGESGGAQSVIRDEEAYKKFALEGRLHLEACPFSSVMTAAVSPTWTEHPVKRWAKDGANFSISTDDPTCFDNSVAKIWQCQLNAAHSAFLEDSEKEKLVQRILKCRPLSN
ncbi:A-deaminase domain-containing protein [Aphelenchoides bicaudatus]|nr:A-deaminase domain-containing protein [Aphelenchoides bicaudatus]